VISVPELNCRFH